MSLLLKQSPGPPWLPIPHFADYGTVVLADSSLLCASFLASLVMVDRQFQPVSATPWTPHGVYGLYLGRDKTPVPNSAEWWAIGLHGITIPPDPDDPPDLFLAMTRVFRVRWELHL